MKAEGPEVFTGNELLLKGALESDGGVHLLGGYPGSPVAGFFDSLASIKDLLREKGIRAIINNNEALAAAMLNGTQMVASRAIIAMKSVGVHVAADALALGNLSGAHRDGGAIIVYGDDPWSDSTQVPSDSRYISKHLFIPTIEPANPQEVKDYVDLSFKLSRMAELYAGYVLTTNLADGGGTVMCRANQFPAFNTNAQLTLDTSLIDLDKRVLLPPRTWWQEESLPSRLDRAAAAARTLGLNRIEHPATERRQVGFITSGMAHGYLTQALWELGLLGEYPILKLGLTYPVDAEMVRLLAEQCERIVVVEERRGFIEEQVDTILLRDRQKGLPSGKVELWGKQFPGGLVGIPATRGLHPSIIIERLAALLRHIGRANVHVPTVKACQRELDTIESTAQMDVGSLVARTPTFCPGCPHRDTASLCLEIRQRFADPAYMARRYKRSTADLVFHGDTGCYTMLMFPPDGALMHNYSGMGLGAGTGSGIDPFITNKQVVFMGDSTFFHSGQIAISQAIKLGQDITFIILDNRTTGMTGHQPTPGVDYDILGNPTPAQDIEEIVRGIAGSTDMLLVRADPQRRKGYGDLLEQAFLADGVKVIIADKECGITRTRRRRRSERAIVRHQGFLPSRDYMNVNQEICRFCLACTEITGCPGLKHVDTDYGRKIDTDLTWCVNDGACQRIGACSSFELVTVKRKRPPRSRVPELGLDSIPEPVKRPMTTDPAVWRCCLVGFGGMGIGVATSILVRAAHKEGYNVIFLDKKGLAIRNGGTISQVIYNISNQPVTAVIPYGKADLLIGIDILEAARALDPRGRTRIASPDRTAAVINTDKIQTISGLMGREDFDPAALEELIRANTRGDDFLARNISRICEKYLGSKLYANIMMLGFAFQKGLIPVSMHSMAWAIKDTIRTEIRKNLYAFNMGRKLVVQSDLFKGPPARNGWKDVLEDKCRHTIRRYRWGPRRADALRELIAGAVDVMGDLDERLKQDLVVRAYDCMRWGGMDYARRYVDSVRQVYAKDDAKRRFAATSAVLHNLAGAMLIKDGPFLAELATSPEKYARDRDKYNVNPANGDWIVYHHYMRLPVRLGPWRWTKDLVVKDWALKLLKRMTWLRRLGGWHKANRRFLSQYQAAVDAFEPGGNGQYDRQLLQLRNPQCFDCLKPSCRDSGCPLACNAPQWIELASQDRWREAWQELQSVNNFPEFTSAICPAFCEQACKQGLGGDPVQIRQLERQIVAKAFAAGWVVPQPPKRKTGRKVAVIGSGPAGLAAAQQLVRAGHDVTVFERDPQVGGLLRYGIPEFRLGGEVIDRRAEQLVAEGVTFRTAVAVGGEIDAAELRGQFDAMLLAAGAQKPRDLTVPGRSGRGVHFALEYLRQGALAQPPAIDAKDRTVAVIGGGLTGSDCVETALQQGAKTVYQLEIMPRPKTNAGAASGADDHGDHGDHPRVVRRYCVATKEFTSADANLSELHGLHVRWQPSINGPVMQEVPGSDFRLKVDIVLLAMGFEPMADPAVAAQLGLKLDSRGRLVLSEYATNSPGVFAAGDIVEGSTFVATAIDSGRRAAAAIDQYLRISSHS